MDAGLEHQRQPLQLPAPEVSIGTGNPELDARTKSSLVHLQLVQAILEQKRHLNASPKGTRHTSAEQLALQNTTQYTRLYGAGYAGLTGLGVAGLMKVINPASFNRRGIFWLWVGPSCLWGGVQGIQVGFRKSISELLNLSDSPMLADPLVRHLQKHAPNSSLLATVHRTVPENTFFEESLQSTSSSSDSNGVGSSTSTKEQAPPSRDWAMSKGDSVNPEMSDADTAPIANNSGGFFGATYGWGEAASNSSVTDGPLRQSTNIWGDRNGPTEEELTRRKAIIHDRTPEGRAARAAARAEAKQERERALGRKRFGEQYVDPETGGYLPDGSTLTRRDAKEDNSQAEQRSRSKERRQLRDPNREWGD